MKLYLFLHDRVPRRVALVATGVWLALLVFLAIFFAAEPQADFRYGNL